MRILAIIPARFASTRFPGKPLAKIGGKAMLQHVYENVKASALFDDVIVATDDQTIFEQCHIWNAKAQMTRPEHQSGTDRCAEVAIALAKNFDIIVNIQGDEPFIDKQPLQQLLSVFAKEKEAQIATLVQQTNEEEVQNPNTVKVVRNNNGKALYFSRAAIPHIRDTGKMLPQGCNYWKHIGLYAYKSDVLQQLAQLQPSFLEETESLEQLRWLENGYSIYTAETDYKMISVDTPQDLQKAEHHYKSIFENTHI